MQEFKIYIYSVKNQKFIASYVHPLTKRHTRKKFDNKQEAELYKKQVKEKFTRKSKAKYSDMTVEDLIIVFCHEHPKNPFTKKLKHLIDFVDTFGECQIEELTTDAMKSWMDQVQHESGLQTVTMRGLKFKLTSFFKFLEEKEIISESPLEEIYYEKALKKVNTRNLLSEEEIEQLLSALKDYSPGYLYPIVRIFAETGAKIVEIIELTWNDLDKSNMTVTFKKRVKAQERTLKLSEELIKHLPKKKSNTNLVFQTYYKNPFTRKTLQLAINEFKQRTSFKRDWVPNDLRHSLAVNFLTTGGSLKDLQYTLGHNNVFDTKRLYGEIIGQKVSKKSISPF